MESDFIALYRGQTVAEARLVAVTAEPGIVSRFVRELGGTQGPAEERGTDVDQRKQLIVIRGGGEKQ